MEQFFYYQSPIGAIEIKIEDRNVLHILFRDKENRSDPLSVNKTFEKCAQQLNEYFEGELEDFDLPLSFNGTGFQNNVWHQLTKIPYGKTISYSELAKMIESPKAVRAVGAANGQNPFVIVVPCHRVIGKNGKLTGYGGGLWRKEWLLRHEIKNAKNGSGSLQLNLFPYQEDE